MMSDRSGFGSDDDKSKPICRDFLRNVCIRGDKNCKFYHPRDKKNALNEKVRLLSFCHDFQNGKCLRPDCKFIHCTSNEEDHYNRTGELPHSLLDGPWNKWIAAEVLLNQSGESNIPICKDYLNGECNRSKCKFRHMSNREFSNKSSRTIASHYPREPRPVQILARDDNPIGLFSRREPYMRDERDFYDVEPEYKRRRYLREDSPPRSMYNPIGGVLPQQNGHIRSDRGIWMLEDENAMLHRRISELKKRIDDLQATNEFLLEQNAQMRMNDKGAASLTAVTVPAVTITNTVPAGAQLSAQMQPAQAATPHQMVSAIRTVTASVATVPVSLAAVAGAPVSIATVSMAPVQIPPPIVTMAQCSGPSQQDHSGGPQALPMSISDPTTAPLVSYPIMTRPVLQTNLTH